MTIPAPVTQFITHEADDADIDRLYNMIRTRQKYLRGTRALATNEGDLVLLDGLSPKALNGLGGEVKTIKGQRADVLLDLTSTRVLARSRTRDAFGAGLALQAKEGYVLQGIPLGCCLPQQND